MKSAPEISVVVAHASDGAGLSAALSAIQTSCSGLVAEVIVVRTPGAVGRAGDPGAGGQLAGVRTVVAPAGSLVPVLWGLGAQAARGRIVAFTTSQLRVSPGWARTLCDGVRGETVAVGGPIAPVQGASGAVAAGCLVRFSAFLPTPGEPARPVHDVAGDNAAYLRAAISAEPDLLLEGFWEVEFHRRFRAAGHFLRIHPSAIVTFVGPVHLRRLARERFAHARTFGSTRVSRHGANRFLLLGAMPLVPVVLLVRICRRAWRSRALRSPFLSALPAIAVLTVAWAIGEGTGALFARRAPGA